MDSDFPIRFESDFLIQFESYSQIWFDSFCMNLIFIWVTVDSHSWKFRMCESVLKKINS